MKLNINIEFSGEMADVVKDFNALGSILSSVNCTTSATSLHSHLRATDTKAQHPKVDVTEKVALTPEITPSAPKNATVAPTPEPVKTAEPKPVKNAALEPPAASVPTAPAKKYTLDELLAATAPLMDAGKISELQALMQKFGVPSMMEIPEERYGELATALRELGAEL